MKPEGKVALVTGADSGIGQAIAATFARGGANVVIHYGSDQRGAQSTADQVRHYGREAAVLQADLSEPRNAHRLYEEATAQLGPIDILVNNAGTGSGASGWQELTLEDFTKVLNVDLVSPWVLAQAAAKQMVERGSGVILNVTSVHEEIPSPDPAYTAAKGGLRNVTRALSVELARHGIRANAILPGWIETEMTARSVADERFRGAVLPRIPMRRWGRGADFGGVAVYLMSDASAYHTGDTLVVDGGYSLF